MKRILTILTITITLTLTLTLTTTAQTARPLRVYLASGVVDKMALTSGSSMYHSRLDLDGVEHDDYVSLVVADGDGERRYLLSQVDSLVMPNGRRVVFQGSMTVQPSEARLVTEDSDTYVGPHRSSFSGTFPGQGKDNVTFFWTENDRIRLDVGYESRASQLTTDKTGAQFVFDSADLDAASYTVYYPGKSVTVLSEQTQTGADNSDHIGPSGDCGTAMAMLNDNDNDNGTYSFTLEHKAAYLCFLPHIDYLPSVRIDKIVLTCNNAIAGTYQLASGGLYNSSATSNTITLNLVPQKEKDFFLGHGITTEQDSCAAYMVIAPQDASRSFTATYYLTDTLSHISKVYRQTFSFQPLANTVYPVTCNIRDTEFRTIDLGLSCNWSNVNVNATEPSLKGSDFDSEEEANAALLAQTIVTEWLMPDEDQKEEILEKCDWTWGTYNGKTGYLVTGAAAAKEYGTKLRIFIPSETHVTPAECLAQNYRPVEALMVDLGLPSKTKWAARNIGANSAEDYGYYYAWGEVETKTSYTSGNYKYGTQNLGDNFDISGTQNDAAVVNWGGIWRMPTYSEMNELMNTDNCSWTWSSINGVNGYIVASKAEGNVNRIFLPAAGLMVDFGLKDAGSAGIYATSHQGGNYSSYMWALTFHSSDKNLRNDGYDIVWGWSDYANYRPRGRTIRPVANPNAVTKDGLVLNIVTDSTSWKIGDASAVLYGTLSSTNPLTDEITVGFVVGDSAQIIKGNERFDLHKTVTLSGSYNLSVDVYNNVGYWYRAYVDTGDTIFYGKARHYGYEMVDLGLSVKWANMNLGADAAEDFGNYYAWGEVVTKKHYLYSNYLYGNRNLGEGQNIAGTDNDAAYVIMGSAWRMPTKAEMEELMSSDNCSWNWTTQNNVNGYLVRSKKEGFTDRSIFLPATGVMVDSIAQGLNNYGSYPTSVQGGYDSYFLWALTFHSGDKNLRNDGYDIVWGWSDYSNYRAWGHAIRAVAQPNETSHDGISYSIRTDSASWKLGDTSTWLYGTLGSSEPLKNEVTVGFIVGDSAQIEKGNERTLLQKTVTSSGSYQMEIPVHDNMGYWYRAFVETADTIYYGKARHYGYEMVDLGLSVLWANMNVGASQPEDFGEYYAWGEVNTKDNYVYANYQYGNSNLGNGLSISNTTHDAAHVNMKNAWRMPTLSEMEELRDHCTWTWTTQNNVNGYLIRSKKAGYTNRSIFLPAAGLRVGTSLVDANSSGSYVTSRQADFDSDFFYALTIQRNDKNIRSDGYDVQWGWSNYSNYRAWGHSVRAVARPNATVADSTLVMDVLTDSAMWKLNDTEATVYGTVSSTTPLPAGTTIGFVVGDNADINKDNATVYTQNAVSYGSFSQHLTGITGNFGYWYRAYVEAPNGEVFYGTARHFGWEMVDLGLPSETLWANMNLGASRPEDDGSYYSWGETTTKPDYSGSNYTVQISNTNISETIYDVAYMTTNYVWRMPTDTQINELLNGSYCRWTWTTQNDVRGYLITSLINGHYIFMPAAGIMSGTTITNYTSVGSYWSSVVGDNGYAKTFNFNSNNHNVRGDGYSNVFGWNDFGNARWPGRSVRAVANQ